MASAHEKLRASYRPAVESGTTPCVRCMQLIAKPGEPCPACGRETVVGHAEFGRCGWDLDHSDERDGYYGPAHSCCNRRAGALKSVRMRNARAWSRAWLPD